MTIQELEALQKKREAAIVGDDPGASSMAISDICDLQKAILDTKRAEWEAAFHRSHSAQGVFRGGGALMQNG